MNNPYYDECNDQIKPKAIITVNRNAIFEIPGWTSNTKKIEKFASDMGFMMTGLGIP